MTRGFLVLLVIVIVVPVTLAQQLPPPRNPAGDEPDIPPQGPALVAPQNGPQQPAPRPPLGAQAAQKNPGQMLDLFVARHRAQDDRKQARIDRMNQFKAARAVEEQKLYQDWHERYVADTPVRVEYYRALAAAAQSQPAISYYSTPYFYGAGPPVILAPVYAPVVATPIYYGPLTNGIFFSAGW